MDIYIYVHIAYNGIPLCVGVPVGYPYIYIITRIYGSGPGDSPPYQKGRAPRPPVGGGAPPPPLWNWLWVSWPFTIHCDDDFLLWFSLRLG